MEKANEPDLGRHAGLPHIQGAKSPTAWHIERHQDLGRQGQVRSHRQSLKRRLVRCHRET